MICEILHICEEFVLKCMVLITLSAQHTKHVDLNNLLYSHFQDVVKESHYLRLTAKHVNEIF